LHLAISSSIQEKALKPGCFSTSIASALLPVEHESERSHVLVLILGLVESCQRPKKPLLLQENGKPCLIQGCADCEMNSMKNAGFEWNSFHIKLTSVVIDKW
jgi:hypothetical protein